MPKIKFKDNFGLGSVEAYFSILNALEKEGFDEDRVLGLIMAIAQYTQDKKTIHKKEIFEKKVEEIIKEYKEELKNDDYFEAYKEIQKLFRVKGKNPIHRYLEQRYIIISIVLMFLALVASILVPVILKFV